MLGSAPGPAGGLWRCSRGHGPAGRPSDKSSCTASGLTCGQCPLPGAARAPPGPAAPVPGPLSDMESLTASSQAMGHGLAVPLRSPVRVAALARQARGLARRCFGDQVATLRASLNSMQAAVRALSLDPSAEPGWQALAPEPSSTSTVVLSTGTLGRMLIAVLVCWWRSSQAISRCSALDAGPPRSLGPGANAAPGSSPCPWSRWSSGPSCR